jgi:hemoglobin
MPPDNLQGSQDKLFKYLCGWMGGPALYVQQYSYPMLLRRHLPFSINECERDQWVLCMNSALRDEVEDADLHRELSKAFAKVADHMRNK